TLPLHPHRENLQLYLTHLLSLPLALKLFFPTPIPPSTKTLTLGNPIVTPESRLGGAEILDPDPVKGKGKVGSSEVLVTEGGDDNDDDVPFSAKWECIKTRKRAQPLTKCDEAEQTLATMNVDNSSNEIGPVLKKQSLGLLTPTLLAYMSPPLVKGSSFLTSSVVKNGSCSNNFTAMKVDFENREQQRTWSLISGSTKWTETVKVDFKTKGLDSLSIVSSSLEHLGTIVAFESVPPPLTSTSHFPNEELPWERPSTDLEVAPGPSITDPSHVLVLFNLDDLEMTTGSSSASIFVCFFSPCKNALLGDFLSRLGPNVLYPSPPAKD
ncbi:hypothetical protein HAX54_011118, partial [Datura stramonium]|nr:hypothetical protein [Datura stramonium]